MNCSSIPHPPLLIGPDDVERIQHKAETYGWARDARDALLLRADRARTIPLETPDKGGQWPSHYVCTVHNVSLQTLSAHLHQCPVGKELYSGWPYNDVLLYSVHNAYLASVRDLGLAYFLTGDETYAESARNILVQYADKYLTYPIHDVYGQEGRDASIAGARIHVQTLDEAAHILDAIWGYDLAYESLDVSTRLHIENDFSRPAVEVVRRFDVGVDNWQCWHNAAVGCIGLVLGDNEIVDWAINGQSGLLFQLRNGVLSDGFWHEASISYHFYVLKAMIWLAESSIRNGLDIGQDSIALYESMFDAPLKLAYPDLRIPAVDDGDIFSLQRPASDWYNPGMYEVGYTRFQRPCYAAIVENSDKDSLSALLWGEPDLQADACIIFDEPALLDGRGLAILKCKENNVYILMDYGVAGGGHGHLDKLNLVIFCLGEEFAPEPGRASYALPLRQDWYVQTLSHNTVLVNQSSQQLVDGELDFFKTSDSSGVQMMRGRTDQPYPGISMARTVILVEGGGIGLTSSML